MTISLISALAIERIIGIKNTIPWYLPIDISWFKYNTLNKPIIMGRKTFDSIGKILPKRKNIIISQYPSNNKNVTWVTSLQEALQITNQSKEVMVIGGGKIYELFLPYATRLYLTHIDIKINGDITFPDYKSNKWFTVFRKHFKANKENIYDCYFEILERL